MRIKIRRKYAFTFLLGVLLVLSGCKKDEPNGPNGEEEIYVKSVAINSDENIYIGTTDKRIFRSTDNGENWKFLCDTPDDYLFHYIAVNSNGLITIGNSIIGGFLYTPNNGNVWYLYTSDIFEAGFIKGLIIGYDDRYFARTDDHSILYSTDHAVSWNDLNPDNIIVSTTTDLNIDPGNNYFAYVQYRTIFYNSDNFQSWTEIEFPAENGLISAIAVNSEGHIYAGTFLKGIYFSTDTGSSWNKSDYDFEENGIKKISINSNGDIFTVADGGILFRSTDSGNSWDKITIE